MSNEKPKKTAIPREKKLTLFRIDYEAVSAKTVCDGTMKGIRKRKVRTSCAADRKKSSKNVATAPHIEKNQQTHPLMKSVGADIFIDKEPSEVNRKKQKTFNSNRIILGLTKYGFQREERELSTALFGTDDQEPISKSSFPKEMEEEVSSNEGEPEDHDEFFRDDLSLEVESSKRKPAWVDDHDETVRIKDVVAIYTRARGTRGIRETSDEIYGSTLREKFSEVMGTPDWASLDREIEDDEDDDLTKKTAIYLAPKSSLGVLPKTLIVHKFLRNLNSDSYGEGSLILAIEYNENLSIALVAGCTKTYGAVTLFQFDGRNNHKIQSIKFPKFPISCARFFENGKKFIVSSHLYGNFYIYDIEEGKKIRIPWHQRKERKTAKKFEVSPNGKFIVVIGSGGYLHFFSAKTFTLIETTTLPCKINDVAFDEESTRLFTHGDNGRVYIISIMDRCCQHSFFDDGCINGTSIAVSPNGRLLACGSSSGIVNIYDLAVASVSVSPSPLKSFGNLTTSITSLKFNCTSEILTMASNATEHAIKLVHIPSFTVFTNFPGSKFNMKRINTVTFSPDSKYLSIGNNAGAAYICRLFHY